MIEESIFQLLQRYRRDRRILLRFILSSSLIKKVVLPPGAVSLDDINLDQVCTDHVVSCAKKGGRLELSEAIRDYHDGIGLPQIDATGSNHDFFLVTNPDSSGSPPRRLPPAIPPVSSDTILSNLTIPSFEELTVDNIQEFEVDDDLEEVNSTRGIKVFSDEADIALLLPSFPTGITDDELRETAYELLLACVGVSGNLTIPLKDRRKDRKHRFMKKLGRSRGENVLTEFEDASGSGGMLEVMRVQMQISERMDILTRKALLGPMVEKSRQPMDSLLIPMELLCSILRVDFPDTKTYIRWERRQLKMLEEGLLNYPVPGIKHSLDTANEFRKLLAKIEESESLQSSKGEIQRMEWLRSLREIAVPLSRIEESNGVCHWADGYHLNVKLYEKLLESVFDVLDEGKIIQEVEDILDLLKSTWNVLGISKTIHLTCYSWVLFKQFISTGELGLLKHAIEHLTDIPKQRTLSLKSQPSGDNNSQDLTFMQSFLLPIRRWADNRLANYHQNFTDNPSMMKDVIVISLLISQILREEPGSAMLSIPPIDEDQIESYISSSLKAEFTKILEKFESPSTTHDHHSLVSLAEETKELLRKDISFFTPIFRDKHPQSAIVSATLLHKLYWARLKPFIHSAEHLSEEVASVLHASDTLEQYVINICNNDVSDSYIFRYPIGEKVQTLVMRWVNLQLERILNWVARVIDQENWAAISSQQRYGSSIVEVYRIVEETVDQFFALKVLSLPLKKEMSSLLRGIDNAFQVYANLVANLASKEDLIPPEPILTRYKRDVGITAFVKKEFTESKRLDIRNSMDINSPPTQVLCVRLNTLYYALNQSNKLEESIRDRWINQTNDKSLKVSLDESRKTVSACIDRVCEYTATKLIFWDLKDPFIENLYKPSVAECRLDTIIEPLDMVLNQLCSVIVDPLRDQLVASLLRASLDGLLRVILNGGPMRGFSVRDSVLLQEDLKVLKEFFISGGDGLPRGVVESLFASSHHVVELMGRETRELIEVLRSMGGVEGDAPMLLRVLCHRNDSEASHFLKKQYRIPTSASIH